MFVGNAEGKSSAGVICSRDDMSLGFLGHQKVKESHGRQGEDQRREDRDRASPRFAASVSGASCARSQSQLLRFVLL